MSLRVTKPTKWPMHPVKTQISLGIRPVWSESSLSAWSNIGPLTTYWVHSEDSDQTWRMPRLIWVFAGHTSFYWFCRAAALISQWLYWPGFFPQPWATERLSPTPVVVVSTSPQSPQGLGHDCVLSTEGLGNLVTEDIEVKQCCETHNVWAASWHTSKMACAPSELRSAWASPQSDQSAVCMKKHWVLSYPLSSQRRLIRLGRCPG